MRGIVMLMPEIFKVVLGEKGKQYDLENISQF